MIARTPRVADAALNAIRIALSALALAAASASVAAPRTLDRDSFERIRAAHAGRPLVVHLWGVTCAPCVAELPRWGALRRERPAMNLVLIQVEAAPPAEADRRLGRAGLATAESWSATAEPDEFVRASIDPQWAGDMPRTLLIAADGRVERIQGSADFAQVRGWLDAQRVSGTRVEADAGRRRKP